MPLDPLLANPTPIKVPDPMEQYGNFLKLASMQSEIGKARYEAQQNALVNQAWQQPGAVKNGAADFGSVKQWLAAHGAGKTIPQLEMDQQKASSDQAIAGKNNAQSFNFSSQAMAKDIEALHSKMATISADPAVGPSQMADALTTFYKSAGGQNAMAHGQSLENDLAELHQATDSGQWGSYYNKAVLGAKTAAEQSITKMTSTGPGGTQQNIVSTPKFALPGTNPTAEVVPGSTQGYEPKVASTTNIINNIPAKAANKYGEVYGEGVAKADLGLRSAAIGAPQGVANIDQMLHIIDTGSPMVGAGAEVQTKLMALAKAVGLNVDDKTLQDSQTLAKMLSQNVLDRLTQMKSSGLPISRATNMELEQLRNSSPSVLQDPATVRRLLLLERQALAETVTSHNTRMSEIGNAPGSLLDPTMKALVSHPLPEIVPYGIPPEAVNDLRQHAGDPKHLKMFDDAFKLAPGTAQRLVGGSPTGQVPFPTGRQ